MRHARLLAMPIKSRPERNVLSYWKTQHFKALQDAWYKRLSDVGFKDSEEPVGDEMELKQSSYQDTRPDRYSELTRQTREEYYMILSEYAKEAIFEREVDQVIMMMRSSGSRIKEIRDELKKIGKSRCLLSIRIIIRRYEVKWGIKKYTPRQMNNYKTA